MLFQNYKNLRAITNLDNRYLLDAISTLFARHDFHTSELSKINIEESNSLWDKFINNRSIDDLDENELEEADKILKPIFLFNEHNYKLIRIIYTLEALFFFISRANRNDILNKLSKAEWHEKHEILTRFLWISEQDKNIKIYSRPYLCEVGSNINRQTIDREFHTYLVFAPFFNKLHKNEILLLGKSNFPDFISEDKFEHQISFEITEALPDSKLILERKQFEILSDKIKSDFGKHNITISFWTRPSWSYLVNNYKKLKHWCSNIFTEYTNDKNATSKIFRNEKLKTSISLRNNKIGIYILDSSGDGTGLPFVGDIIEQRVSQIINSTIRNKISKKYAVKSILVVYENTGLFAVEFNNVITRCNESNVLDSQNMFQEIWITTDQESYLLFKK